MSAKIHHILLAEDNPDDVRITREVLKDTTQNVELNVARNGLEVLAFLNRQPPFENAPRPDLILLDLNMPRMGGLEVLAKLREDIRFTHLPVVVLTTSSFDEDVTNSYRHHANAYVVKPVDLNEFEEAIQMIEKFWFQVARLPGKEKK